MAHMEPTPEFEQAIKVMKDDALRSYTIDIETDSTVAADEQMDKQGVAEFTAAMSQFLGQIFPIVQQQPAALGPLGKMMLWMSRKFRIARDAEDEIEDFLQAFEQMPDQADPEAEKAKAEVAAKAEQAQAELQLKAQETKADIARKDAEAKAKIEREERMAQLDEKKALLDIREKEEKIRLMREEAEVKVIMGAADRSEKSQSDSSSKSSDSKVSLNIGETQPKNIELVRKDGQIVGAKVTPIEAD